MSLDKFGLQSNNGKQIDLQNLKELKKSDLGNNNALIQLFNIFDTKKADGTAGSDGVLNKSELISLFNTFNAGANSSKGMSKSVFELNEAEEYLNTTKTTSDKTLSEIGVKAADLFEFLSKLAQNSNTPVNVNNVANDVHLTEEQAQEEVISTISEDTANARTLLMKQDNGHISQLYNKAKELFDSDLSLSNVEEAFMLQEECLENLSKAKEGKLSKREYFLQNREHLKTMMKRRLFRKDENTGLDFLDNNRGKMSKQEFAKFMEDYINEKINETDRLDSLNKIQHSLLTMGASGVNNVLKKYQKAAQNKQITDFSVESKSAKLPSKTSAIPQKYNTTEPMTFKEVFEIERNQEYSKDRIEAYISQKQKTDFAVGAYNKYQSFKMNSSEILNDYTKSVAGTYAFGGMAAGVQPNPEKQMQKVLEAFESYYANPIDPNSARKEIETLVKDNKLPISVIQDSNGKLLLDLSKLKTDVEKNNVLNKLLKLEDTKLEAKLKTTLGGEVDEMLEMFSTNTQIAFTNAYGHDFTNELVQEMSDDNKTFIQKYTGNTSQIGMGLTVVGGVLCFTPLAGVGAAMVGVGNTMAIGGMVAESALGFEEALSRSNLNLEEIKELSKTLVMNAGGFVVGYKAGQTGMKAFNKLIDKKLAEVFKTEMANGNRAEALKQVFSNPEYLKNFMQAAGVKLSADFMISYAGDLAMMGILDTNDDWKSLLQSNLIGIMTSMGGDLKDVANLGIKGNKAKRIQKEGVTNNKAQELAELHNDTEIKNKEDKSNLTVEKAETTKTDNTPHPNPLPQGAREQNSVHVDKNADGTFNVKDGDYYWHVKNNEELSFVTDYLSQRKDLSGMLIKEKVRDDGSKLIKEVDPQTGKSVRTTKVNSDGSIEYITFCERKNGVTTKAVELYSDKAFVTNYRTSNGKYQVSKETEIYSNGQKNVTVYDSYGKVEEKYSIPNVELVVNKDGSYVSEENIDILMQKFGITDRNEAAMLLENVIDCGVNDRFLRILTNLNDTNKNIILPLVKNNKTAYIAYNIMENVNATNKDVLEFATKNLNISELDLFDLSSFADKVNASRILNALKEGKDLRVLSNRYHDLKCIYDPIMQKMDSTNKVEFIQKEIDSFEQDLSKITNEPLKYIDLFALKLQNKERYERILNSGLIEALENGTVKNVKIPRLTNADLSPEIYSDLKLLKEGKSIVKEFSADTDINEAYKATSIGDVVEVGRQMYINDGKKLSKWNMTKEMFLKLFPPVDRFAFKQKKLGDCYLLSSISSVMRNKKASVTFYQSFEYDGKDVKVTVKAYEDYNGSQTFTNGELSNLGKKQVEGCRGVQLYERTYAKVALREQDIIYPNTAEGNALMQRIEGGRCSQAVQEILGTKVINYDDAKSDMMIENSISIPYKRNSASTVKVELEQFNSKGIQDILNNFKENQPNTSIALYLGNSKNIKTVIDYLANNDDIILNFGTKHDLKLTDILKKQHAYSVCGYNKSTGIVKVVDPYNNSNIKEIHIDELSKLTDTIYITNLAK